MNDQTKQQDNNRVTPTNYNKSMDKDTHLDQLINKEIINLKHNMT